MLCSKAAIGTCCTVDPGHPGAGHYAWKYGTANVIVGSSCAEARKAYCTSRKTYGTKYCPGISTRPIANTHIKTTSQTDPYGKAPKAVHTLPSRFDNQATINHMTQIHTFDQSPLAPKLRPGQRKSSVTPNQYTLSSRFPAKQYELTSRFNDLGPDATPSEDKVPTGADIFAQLCPYFKWMPIGGPDCKWQVVAGAAAVVIGGAVIFRILKKR